MTEHSELTPMMRQYHAIKAEAGDALLFFRLGDFYELFFDDALTASRELEITLTARHKDSGSPVPMCGVPYHAADSYIARLLKKGFKVAICDQTEAPQKGTKLVRREVTRVITPGTVTDPQVLTPGENNFLLGLAVGKDALGLALLDLSTGEFRAAEHPLPDGWNRLASDCSDFAPREVVCVEALKNRVAELQIPAVSHLDAWHFDPGIAENLLREHFSVTTLDGFGLGGKPLAIGAAGGVLRYAMQTQKSSLAHLTAIAPLVELDYLVIDSSTARNLELVASSTGEPTETLLSTIDRTLTPMGSRLLRQWILRPSRDASVITSRLDAVEDLRGAVIAHKEVRDALDGVLDLERLLSRIIVGTASPRDLVGMRSSLSRLPRVRQSLNRLSAVRLAALGNLDPCDDLHALLVKGIADEPPVTFNDGGVIRDGFNVELDALRDISKHGKDFLAAVETRERQRTGVASLKVRFNRIFGYYIEVSKSNLHLVPPDYDRKQTLVGGERFTTPELKVYEEKILTAEDRILVLEREVFATIRSHIADHASRIRQAAACVAEADILACFALIASTRGYSRPELSNRTEYLLMAGRHPVIEVLAEDNRADRFVPNDLYLAPETDQIVILTGPNMGGKSTYLRQAALLVIMAQMGSFVPADRMRLSLIDRVFTRVGASDNLVRGRSTFMVEMAETALILNSATAQSLVVLDEVGRGTATYDGMALAWAVIEHLQARIGAMTLFATHYHELTALAETLEGVRNFHVTVREAGQRIVFLRKVAPGAADKSYGIEVARLAGVPRDVTDRAAEILKKHEEKDLRLSDNFAVRARRKPEIVINQLALFTAAEESVREELRALDLDHLTPVEAFRRLADLKKKAE